MAKISRGAKRQNRLLLCVYSPKKQAAQGSLFLAPAEGSFWALWTSWEAFGPFLRPLEQVQTHEK